jgi:hypothetical protein
VAVYGEGLHSLISLPASEGRHEEWAFGERIWFMDDKHGLSEHARELGHRLGGAFKALFWPSAGVVELTRSEQTYPQRYPEDAVKSWNLTVSEEGLRRMRAYLEASRASASASPM